MNINAISTSLSGLNAASTRLSNSAHNVANIHSTSSHVNGKTVNEPFKPQQIQQTSMESGGVRTESRDVDPATIPVFDPDNTNANANGITEYPNVNMEREVVGQQIASYDFKANLKAIAVQDENAESLLNILT